MSQPQLSIRPAEAADLPAILALNAASVEVLSPMDQSRFELLTGAAALTVVATLDERVEAFLMGFRDGAAYDSDNFAWFNRHYRDFFYVDRVVVSANARGHGVGSALYEDVIAWARKHELASVVAEVVAEPANEESLGFHRKFGFTEVERRQIAPDKVLSMQQLVLSTS